MAGPSDSSSAPDRDARSAADWRTRLRALAPDRPPTPREVLALCIVAVVLVWLLWQRCGVAGCPDVETLNSYRPGGATVLEDRDGRRFADLAPVHHAVVPLASLPPYVPAAFVSVEDKRFYQHHGVDWYRVFGAAWADLKAGGFVQGFSTITMQLARNVWHDRIPGEQRTLKRKLLEIRVARDIERHFTKSQILGLYLNQINFGEGAFGIEAAAETYFDRSARSLTLAQAATLAAIPRSPVLYDPRRHPHRARARRNLILGLMATQHLVPADRAGRAERVALGVAREPPPEPAGASAFAADFVEQVRRVLEAQLGDDIYTAPLRVITTLDRSAQRVAKAELDRQLRWIEHGIYGPYAGPVFPDEHDDSVPEGDYLQGAVVVMRADSGDVLALVGGRDATGAAYDRAASAEHEAGGAFRPFVYAAAIASGYVPSQRIADTPLEGSRGGAPGSAGGPGEPPGEVTLRDALVHSLGAPTLRLARAVGPGEVMHLAHRTGITSRLPAVPAAAAGEVGVTPLELTSAYTAFAHRGDAVQPRYVLRVEDLDGNVVWSPGVVRRHVLPSGVAYLVTDMLSDAVNEGTGSTVRDVGFRGPVAGKTGSTFGGTDAWFVGYTPRLAATVWIGFDHPRPIIAGARGGELAAPVWGRIMQRVLAGRPRVGWTQPRSVVVERIDPASGLVLQQGCRPVRGPAGHELFVRGLEPASTCPEGQPERGAGLLARAAGRLRTTLRTAQLWIARHLGREAPAPPRERNDRFLGVPRLPPQGELPPPLPELKMPDFRDRPVVPGLESPAGTAPAPTPPAADSGTGTSGRRPDDHGARPPPG